METRQDKKQKVVSLILYVQRLLKVDIFYLLRGGSWLAFGQIMNTVFSFILIVGFANLLPKETYGVYRYILSLAAVLNVFALTGMNGAVTRSVARGDDGSFRVAVGHQLKFHLIMAGVFFLIAGYYFLKDDILFALSFLMLGLFVPPTLAFNTYGSYLVGKKNFKLANILSIVSTAIFSASMLLTLFYTNSVTVLILIYASSTFIMSILSYVYVIRRFNPPANSKDSTVLSYGWKLSLIGLVAPIASQIDKIILMKFWGPAQLAAYSFAMFIPEKLIPYLKKFVNLGAPKFAARNINELDSVLNRRILQGLGLGLFVAVLYSVSAPYIFRLFLPQYIDSVFYSQILSLSFIVALPTRYLSQLFESQKKARELLQITFINSILLIILYLVFGTSRGIIGLVSSYVAWSFLGMLINFGAWKILVRRSVVSQGSE